MRKFLLPAIVVAFTIAIAIAIGAKFYLDSRAETTPTPPQTTQTAATENSAKVQPKANFSPQTFQNIKSAHFVSSEPANNARFAAPISELKLTFNFDLASSGSKISVMREGEEVTTGATQVIGDSLILSVPVKTDTTGNYKVIYTACWFDKSCHDGSFGFSVQLP